MGIENIQFESGYMVLVKDQGPSVRVPMTELLRAADIPTGLTYLQVGAVTTLANMVVVLIRTLIDRDILDESFLENGDIDINTIVQAIEEMGGSYEEPDLSVT